MSYIPPPPAEPPRIPGPADSGPSPRPTLGQRFAAVPKPALIGGAVAVVLGSGYLVASLVVDETIAAGTSVHGVEIGGLSPDDAEAKLGTELASVASEPIEVFVGDVPEDPADPYLLDPTEAGLALDIAATVEQADRAGLWGRIFGSSGGELKPAVAVDEDQALAELESLAEATGTENTEGAIGFADGAPVVTEPASGATLEVDSALELLTEDFPQRPGSAPLALPVSLADPLTDTEEVDRALREFAEPAMSAPVLLLADGDPISLTPEMISRHLTMAADEGGRLEPRLDTEELLADEEVQEAVDAVAEDPVDARLGLSGGEIQVTAEALNGFEVVTDDLGELVLPLLSESGAGRTAELPTREVTPTLTRENVAELGIVEEMSSFTVEFEPAEYRITNIGRAAELINGSVVSPGDVWSFNETVGRRTEENGFVEGVIILDDQYQTAQGGGVSAVATTMFNAVFFAGVKPVEYGAHSFYIERYPEGREATVAWGHLDNSFENDSGNTIYILATSTDSSVTITFLGTKKYDEVESVTSDRTNVVKPGKREAIDDDCVAQPPLEGFDVVVERVFHNGGDEVGREEFKTTYTPRDEVVCEDSEDDSDDD